MSRSTTKEHPFWSGVWYGFITILFSHIPILIVFFIQWARDSQFPGFSLAFDSGRLVAVWIPLIVMLLLSFYEVKEYKFYPVWEAISLVFVILLAIASTSLYLSFYLDWIPYGRWVKWLSLGILAILFILMIFSNYLENKSVDVQGRRAQDQNSLDYKANKMNK